MQGRDAVKGFVILGGYALVMRLLFESNLDGVLSFVLSIGFLFLFGAFVVWFDDTVLLHRPASHPWNRAAYPDDWEALRQAVLERDGYRCGNCQATTNLRVHHIVPLSKGGTNSLGNLRTLCDDCHEKLHPHMM